MRFRRRLRNSQLKVAMRLFVAIDLPPEIKAKLVTLKTDLIAAAWVKTPALHLTLRFLGDGIDPVRLPPIITVLRTIRAAPFSLTLSGAGRFPSGNRRPARVLWVGIAEQPSLIALQSEVNQALASVDFPANGSAFIPHITLAHLKSDGNGTQVSHFLERESDFVSPPFPVTEFHLMSSRLTPQGAEYRQEYSFPLAN